MLSRIIFLSFVACTLVQLFYWLFFFAKLARYKLPKTIDNQYFKPVSVIICVKNEAENLQKNLSKILVQEYPVFEIVVVNDGSTDKTLEILLEFKKKFSYLRIINLSNTPPGKKFALAKGIEAAQHEIVLLTDADCHPTGTRWLAKMQATINDQIAIGLGYGPYQPGETYLSRFIRFETIYTAIQYLSFALRGIPYMGVGRNLIYKKSLFYHVGGFETHTHLASGDDDLFINEVAKGDNTTIVLDPDTFMYSTPKKNWRGYYRQKSRHMSTGSSYKPLHQVLLGMLSASHFGHYVFGIALIVLNYHMFIFLTLYLLRMIVVLLVCKSVLQKLNDKPLLKYIPILDVLYILYYLILTPVLLKGNHNRWK